MTRFTVEFFEDTQENKPVEEFLLGLDLKMRAKLLGLLQILQEKGNGFIKKARQTPPEEIRLAKKRRKAYLERNG